MAYRPFLSHKREDAADLAELKLQLCRRGAGGWQDASDLKLGQSWRDSLSDAIRHDTGGFIWFGTRRSLQSQTICRVEIPTALDRAEDPERAPYPVVPVFVDLDPTEDADAIIGALGDEYGPKLLDMHGVTRSSDETLPDLCRKAARAYVRAAILEHGGKPLCVAVSGGRRPVGDHDLTLDWSDVLDQGRPTDRTDIDELSGALVDIRSAAQEVAEIPQIELHPQLRLPLAAMVGWAWNRVHPVALSVMQPSPARGSLVPATPEGPEGWDVPRIRKHVGAGPRILAVTIGAADPHAMLDAYATTVDASAMCHLHIDRDAHEGGELVAAQINSLAAWTVRQLGELRGAGGARQLLLMGPVSLAVLVGWLANGTGRVEVPFWDGDAGYVSGPVIG